MESEAASTTRARLLAGGLDSWIRVAVTLASRNSDKQIGQLVDELRIAA